MTVDYTYHEGSQETKPATVDNTSSKDKVYLRRNIERITKEDPQSGETIELWGYEEAELTPTEYATYVGEDGVAKAEYVAMMTDVDLLEV